MRKSIRHITSVLILALIVLTNLGFRSGKTTIIPDFALKSTTDKIFATAEQKNAKGFIVIFTCNHCPFAKLYSKRMNALYQKYTPLNVPLIAINSMDTLIYKEECFEFMKIKVENDSLTFPYLQDGGQSVGKIFGAAHTPSAYVIWKEQNQWVVKYKGLIDDNGEKPQIATPFIANAVDALLEGKPVSVSETQSFGCAIFYRK